MEHFAASTRISWSRTQFQLLSEVYINCFQTIYVYFPPFLRQVYGLLVLQEGITSLTTLAEWEQKFQGKVCFDIWKEFFVIINHLLSLCEIS